MGVTPDQAQRAPLGQGVPVDSGSVKDRLTLAHTHTHPCLPPCGPCTQSTSIPSQRQREERERAAKKEGKIDTRKENKKYRECDVPKQSRPALQNVLERGATAEKLNRPSHSFTSPLPPPVSFPHCEVTSFPPQKKEHTRKNPSLQLRSCQRTFGIKKRYPEKKFIEDVSFNG